MKWFALLLLALPGGCKKPAPAPLATEAYVWQSAEKPAVRDAMAAARGVISTFHVRAAELRWEGGKFAVTRFVKSLPAADCGVVVRIGSSASRLEWTAEQIEPVAAVFRELAGWRPREIQCDFDCPQKRLASYGKLIAALQSAAGDVPVLPTTLPSWLGEPAFRDLIAGRPGYVLQVHSLQLPQRPSDPVVLFDPAAARIAVKKASALGVPFRVAMATYGCEVRFGPDGKVVDVISEDTGAPGPAATNRAFAMADPAASARLVREWKSEPPAGLRGIIWYRLPVEGDRRNWPWETLQLVARGEEAPAVPALEILPGPASGDLFVANHGKFPLLLPAEIVVTSPVTATDGAGAYRLERRADGLHFLRRDDIWPWLDPGKKLPAGWLRAPAEATRIDSHFSP